MCCLTRKILKCNNLVVYFFKKRHHIAKTGWRWIPRDPSSIFLATTFTRKMSGSSHSMYSSYFMLENTGHHPFTWSGPNSQEIVNFVPILGPRGPELNWNKFTISCEFDPRQVKWWYHMFSSIKMEEYMEPELSGLFWVKRVAKNIVLGSPGIHFMHMRVKNTSAELLHYAFPTCI